MAGVAGASFLIAWVHFNLFWLPILTAGVYLGTEILIKIRRKVRINWRRIGAVSGAVLGGVVLGWILRPEPMNTLRLVYTQLVTQTLVKQSGLPILFGAENWPIEASVLLANFWGWGVGWGAGIILGAGFVLKNWRKLDEEKFEKIILMTGMAILSILFFGITILMVRRAYNFWILFGVLMLGALTGLEQKINRKWVYAVGTGLVFLILFSGLKTDVSLKSYGYPPDRLKEVGIWLRDNSEEGEVVFNIRWPDFSPLFFWNQKNYYIGGLDPIFQYADSKNLYWKFHYLATDAVTEKTCGYEACTAAMLEDTDKVLRDEFRVKFIVIRKSQNPILSEYFSGDKKYKKALEAGDYLVFEIGG